MAYLKRSLGTSNNSWCISFRWDGVHYTRSCRTRVDSAAQRLLGIVQDTLALLQTGRVVIPPNVNPGDWILSGGKAVANPRKAARPSELRLSVVCEEYLKDQVGKAESTVAGERIHIGRLKSILLPGTLLTAVNLDVLKRYARKRSQMKFRGKLITGTTIRKELMTFRQIWLWAKRHKRLSTACPLYDEDGLWQIPLPKPAEGKRFQTWRQIQRQIIAGDLSEDIQKDLWRGLYLDNGQVVELLEHFEKHARYTFVHPMMAFLAYTGCRRSEMLRAQIIDVDFDEKEVVIRECKRRKDLSGSTRILPLHDRLAKILRVWLTKHNGGRHLFTVPLEMPFQKARKEYGPMTRMQAYRQFKATLAGSKWEVVTGFHVLRHSFGANLARSGRVSETTIGAWMGHTTQDMRSLYQHLFPQDGAGQISVLE